MYTGVVVEFVGSIEASVTTIGCCVVVLSVFNAVEGKVTTEEVVAGKAAAAGGMVVGAEIGNIGPITTACCCCLLCLCLLNIL